MERVAIIDLGSNSARAMLMEVHGCEHYKLIDELQEPVRISENMGKERMIKPQAINRAVQSLKAFKKFCKVNDVSKIFAVATAAVRNAKNKFHVLNILKEETGITLRVLSGEEEAYYEYLGVVNSMTLQDSLIVDIGGGSTEIILCKNRKMMRCISLPIGAVNITEEFLSTDAIPEENIEALNEYLKSLYSEITWLEKVKNDNLSIIGVGGTMRNLARIDRSMVQYSFTNILRNYEVRGENIKPIYKKLYTTSLDDRKYINGISKNRVDIIVGGVAIASSLVEFVKSPKIRISGYGLREGVFYEYLFKNKSKSVVDDVIEHSVRNFMSIYNIRKKYVEQVSQLSLFIYEQLRKYYGYGEWERKLLYIASLLYDIGTAVCYYDYPKHTMYILLNARLNGLTHREQILIALITACHKKTSIKSIIKQYSDVLLPEDEVLVRRLGEMLRMGEKINRGSAGTISGVVEIIRKKDLKFKSV